MTSATDRLRALLDERGVLHGYVEPDCVWWEGDDGIAYEAIEVYVLDEPSGYFAVRDLTTQQAIDATLGRGTCKLDFVAFTKDGVDFAGFRCDGCGFTQAVPGGSLWGVTRDWSYCPNCGAKVVE